VYQTQQIRGHRFDFCPSCYQGVSNIRLVCLVKVIISPGWIDSRFYYQSWSISYSSEVNCTNCKHSGATLQTSNSCFRP